jgi:hypothetical protein
VIVSPDTVRGSFQPAGKTKGGVEPWKIDYSKPFYETMLSPSAEKLSVTFFAVEWQYKSDWDKDAKVAKVNMPDGSRVYMDAAYNEADQEYIAKQFWDQRWSRYAEAAWSIALWALVPCAVLFILGYALLWVGRGFRSA